MKDFLVNVLKACFLRRSDRIEGFDFLVYSVWPELEARLEFNLKSIYSPGNTDVFFKVIQTSLFVSYEENCTAKFLV